MRRKIQPKSDAVVPAELLEKATEFKLHENAKPVAKCTICGAETPSSGTEPLCWVCRRLKISAWRDIEQQMPAQE